MPEGSIFIISQLIQRLQCVKPQTTGELYGVEDPATGRVTLLAVASLKHQLPHSPTLLLPPPLEWVGDFYVLKDDEEDPPCFEHYQQPQPLQRENLSLTLCVQKKEVRIFQQGLSVGQLHPVDYSIVSQERFERDLVACRLQVCLDLSCGDGQPADADNVISSLQSLVQSSASFLLKETNLVLGVRDVLSYGGEVVDTIGELINKDNTNGYKRLDALLFSLLVDRSISESTDAPLLNVVTNKMKIRKTLLKGECVVYMFRSSPVENVGRVLQKSLLQKISLAEHWLKKTSINFSGNLDCLNVLPYKAGHMFTLLYPSGSAEDDLQAYRGNINEVFLLPMKSPFMRKTNSFVFEPSKESYQLCNTHVGLKAPSVSGMSSITQGVYSYHHYMQEKFNDNKWGCAYRSLQTVVSWFRHQGYTTKPVPTHTQIQQCLVDIGDKPSKFVGSRDWIGSTEVGFVLESYLGVTSRFLNVSTGGELGERGRELVHHFNSQGTPIMIGGGVLAHTILGVTWDPESGDISYLVLDPHYTGGEDLALIQRMGWCGWKGPKFWNDKAYYNLCLPQRPAMV